MSTPAPPLEHSNLEQFKVDALAEWLAVKYRRPLFQIFTQRRVAAASARGLLRLAFRETSEAIQSGAVRDSTQVPEFLYRRACSLATSYWDRELLRWEFEDDARP